MVGSIPELLTFLLTPILTFICMSNAICHICQLCHLCHIWHIWWFDIHHMYVCQYGCQKKRWDLRNAANHWKYPTKLFLGPTNEISWFLIFPLYFSELSFIYFVSLEAALPGNLEQKSFTRYFLYYIGMG